MIIDDGTDCGKAQNQKCKVKKAFAIIGILFIAAAIPLPFINAPHHIGTVCGVIAGVSLSYLISFRI